MSSNFGKNFLRILHDIIMNDTRYEMKLIKRELFFKSFIIATGLSCHCGYTLVTSKNEKLTIVKKYKMVRNGFTEFMVIDKNGRHFNFNNSLWYWKWDSLEDWNNIKNGDELCFKYYGWRVPFLGLFPNIYRTKHISWNVFNDYKSN